MAGLGAAADCFVRRKHTGRGALLPGGPARYRITAPRASR
jgi:hypothetical protein